MFTTSIPAFFSRRELADDQIRSLAPSVFAAAPLPEVSERYAFVPTAQIVSRLRESGWSPVMASEQTVRLENRRGFQKHLLRFQRRDVQPVAGEYSPELVLVNSHDRSSAYQLHAGLFRFVCGNGMIIADTTFERVSIRHSGFTPDEVIEASFKLLDRVPAITARDEVFKQRQLDVTEKNAFAEAALRLRFETVDEAPISTSKLLDSRRYEDKGDDLWHTLNRVQENLIRGGQRDYSRCRKDGRRFRQWSIAQAQHRGKKQGKMRASLWRDFLAVVADDEVPLRPERREPRAVKKKSKYPLLKTPRRMYVESVSRTKRRILANATKKAARP